MRETPCWRQSSTEIAVIDAQERVLLTRSRGDSYWRPPRARVVRAHPSGVTLVRIRDPLFTHWYVTVIRVVGTYASPGRFDTHTAGGHVFVARRDKMREITIRPSAGAAPDCAYAWYPLIAVEGGLNVRPHELGLFLRGYLEGWIPDGTITLTG